MCVLSVFAGLLGFHINQPYDAILAQIALSFEFAIMTIVV